MPGYLAGRRQGRIIPCATPVRSRAPPAPCRVTRQIQTQRPLRRIEVLDKISHIRHLGEDGAEYIDVPEREFCFGFPVHNGAVDRADKLLDEFRPRHLKAVYYPAPWRDRVEIRFAHPRRPHGRHTRPVGTGAAR